MSDDAVSKPVASTSGSIARVALVCGASASGKDHLVALLSDEVGKAKRLLPPGACVSFIAVGADDFYKPLTPEQKEQARANEFNFDEPCAIDGDLLVAKVQELSDPSRDFVDLPIYDFSTHSRRTDQVNRIMLNKNDTRRIIVVQGIFVLCYPELRALSSLNVFLQTDGDVVALRRVARDTVERGRDVAGVISQYHRTVKPGFEAHVLPSSRYADLSFPWQQTNHLIAEALSLSLLLGTANRSA